MIKSVQEIKHKKNGSGGYIIPLLDEVDELRESDPINLMEYGIYDSGTTLAYFNSRVYSKITEVKLIVQLMLIKSIYCLLFTM